MDNRVFNVNGEGDDLLRSTLYFAFSQAGHRCEGWRIDVEKGFILYWHVEGDNPLVAKFPFPIGSDSVFSLVKEYLARNETWKEAKLTSWDRNADHDGSNSQGWRVYTEDWGQIAHDCYAFLAITPAYLWHGK